MWWDTLGEIEREHPGLVNETVALLEALRNAPERFGATMIDYMYSLRPHRLADTLDAAGVVLATGNYAAALGLLRTGLEHVCVDMLLFNAAKRRDRFAGVSSGWEKRQRDAWAAHETGTDDIESITRVGKDVFVVRAAYRLVNDKGDTVGRVSPYAVAMEHHSPFVGKKADQDDRLVILSTLDEQRSHAERNVRWYNEMLSWKAIKENLVLNGFFTDRDVRRVDLHYSFLSAFVHGFNDAYRLVTHHYDRACHICAEMAMLYIAQCAVMEVNALVLHCAAKAEAADFADLRRAVAAVEVASSHLWFPPGGPLEFDRHQEVLKRQAPIGFGRSIEPSALHDDDVTYYTNPLLRLARLHQTTGELVTGLRWVSPWPRSDVMHL